MQRKVILFDWSGTLAKPHTREIFIEESPRKKLKCLYPDTLPTLNHFYKKGIPMGIISNTKQDPLDLQYAMMLCGLDKYFEFSLYTNGKRMCNKPCTCLFEYAYEHFKHKIPNLKPRDMLYVGNDYKKDIISSKTAGLQSIHIVRKTVPIHVRKKYVIRRLTDLMKGKDKKMKK